MFANVLNMMRAELCSISFYVSCVFKFTKSFSMKMKLRHALYFLLAFRCFHSVHLTRFIKQPFIIKLNLQK